VNKSLALLSEITVFQKYARYITDENRRETWDEIVNRWQTMMVSRYPYLQTDIESVVSNFIKPKLVLPSMRGLQFAGRAIERNEVRLFNCSFMIANSIEVFSEAMFLLLSGCGVGYSVQVQHVEQLPEVVEPNKWVKYVVADSVEGWSDAVKALVEAYFLGKVRPIFDYSEIRPEGARLKVSGGRAPGPKPLARTLATIERIFKKAAGRKLKPVEVHSVLCHIAVAVLSGGIRRSAMIALFSPEDADMATCKSGEWWVKNPQFGKANNSMVFLRSDLNRDKFNRWWSTVKAARSGEPGIYLTDNLDWGINPCAEIGLRNMQVCNLTEVSASAAGSQEQLEAMVTAAAFIGTLQAGFTSFHYLRPEWRETTEKEALLGVSMTGIAGIKPDLDLERAASVAVSVNRKYAEAIGINPAARVTCVKPSGTTSLVMGTSSGIHGFHAPYYIRRMRINKTDALYAYLNRRIPELIEDDVVSPTDAVLSVPVKAPDGVVYSTESALSFLERVKKVQQQWVRGGHISGEGRHNVSATVSVGENEWDQVGSWMFENKDYYAGLSVLPREDHTYKQTPFEACSEEKFLEMTELVRGVDLSQVVEVDDKTNLSENVACMGGACLI